METLGLTKDIIYESVKTKIMSHWPEHLDELIGTLWELEKVTEGKYKEEILRCIEWTKEAINLIT